ncbi:MAG TPA: DNA-directed RNA polymerase subunit beta, partial [Planctomycetes bacterium]|nr:DNA-directed RNA polymerase subunit beta [Planctomycetota bacterium]
MLRALNPEWGSDGQLLALFYDVEKVKRPKKGSKAKFAAEIEGRLALEQIRDTRTGEVWAESGQVITSEVAEHIAGSDLTELDLLVDPEDPLIINSLKEDTSNNHEEALSAIYAKLRPGNPVQLEKARELLQDRFFNEARYSLGKVGRFRISRKFNRPDAANNGPLTLQ